MGGFCCQRAGIFVVTDLTTRRGQVCFRSAIFPTLGALGCHPGTAFTEPCQGNMAFWEVCRHILGVTAVSLVFFLFNNLDTGVSSPFSPH